MTPDGQPRPTMAGDPPSSSLLRWGIAGSAAAAFSWLVPDLISSDPVFPLSGLATAGNARVTGMTAVPIGGALSMLVLMIPSTRRSVPWISAILGLAALWISFTMREPALPVSGPAAAGITTAFSLAALALVVKCPGRVLAAHGIALATAFATAVFTALAVATGEQSSSFTAPYREALSLWALSWMFVSGGGLWFGGRR